MMSHFESSETLLIECVCSEPDCATRLELTPDGILMLEDKDGSLVSIMLPEWLDEAVRVALHEHQEKQDDKPVYRQSRWPDPTVDEPDSGILEEWMDYGGLGQTTDGCWKEPYEVCKHGYPTWLQYLGWI